MKLLMGFAETWQVLLVNRLAMCEPSLTGPPKKTPCAAGCGHGYHYLLRTLPVINTERM